YLYYPNGQEYQTIEVGVPVWTTSGLQTQSPTTTYTYDADGRQQTVTDPLGHVTSYQYDAAGNVTTTTFADGTSISDVYDPYGNKISETDQMGRTTTYTYDVVGNLTQVVQPAVADPAITGSPMTTPVTTYVYDAYGDETSQTDANGHTTTFKYDALGQEVSRTLPDGETETFTYDSFGRELTHVDFKGQTEAFVYDNSALGDGRVTGEYFFAAGTTVFSGGVLQTAGAGQKTLYTYDDLGRVKTVTDDSGLTTYTYDV